MDEHELRGFEKVKRTQDETEDDEEEDEGSSVESREVDVPLFDPLRLRDRDDIIRGNY